ncbi:MAG: transcription-repair coupling factor [Pseudomonadota bacterium]
MSSLFDAALALTAPGSRVGGLHGAARALFLRELAARRDAPVLCVTATQRDADQLERELADLAARDTELLHFPDWETLPYDTFSPHQDIISQRLAVLAALPTLSSGIVVVAAASLLQRLPPRQYVLARSLALTAGQRCDRDELLARLTDAGYLRVPEVSEHGEMAVRGSIVDVFPMGTDRPVRVDFFDDEIETLKHFDPDNQVSAEAISRLTVLPGREIPLDEDAIRTFRGNYRSEFTGQASKSTVYRDVSNGIAHGGIEYFLPLFFDTTAGLLDYLPTPTHVVLVDDIDGALDTANADVISRFETLSVDPERPLLKPDRAFASRDDVARQLADLAAIRLQTEKAIDGIDAGTRVLLAPTQAPASELPLTQRLAIADKSRVLFCAASAGRREAVLDYLRDQDISASRVETIDAFLDGAGRFGVLVAAVEDGFRYAAAGLVVVPETWLFGQKMRSRRRRRGQRDPEALISQLNELTPGAPVVHEEYGVGRYVELSTLTVGGSTGEFLTLEYAGGDRLYVPVHALERISRYTGASPEHAPLHRLGTDQWAKAQRRAREKARDVAVELLDVYARRAARSGHSFTLPSTNYRAFEAQFAFEPTEDQQQVIDEVIADMRSPAPMDRVVCGDVGFGKTEVALRAAFVAIEGGKQVAILVPTTLLAQQHYETFRDRFADWPYRIEVLSRFRSPKDVRQVLDGLASGSVDCVVGTHKLLQHIDTFRDIGLVVIDEEHRFGVRHKEAIKTLRAEIDMLTLTATPIPRTLNMALGGLRELSLIATPPSDRLSVKTFVTPWNDGLIREAVLREIKRGGQVYFVHNKVEDIESIAEKLETLIPEATLRIGHGQMKERELEAVMADFYRQQFNLFVCTTIVESGIDVPTANTIVINRADRFGLAQLHQLRGRVGRSHHRAYAYLLAPPKAALSDDAQRRLEAIDSLEDLGAGFALASHDLEIRGAGELLGEGQSGQIQEIGFSMYSDLLAQAVAALKRGEEPGLDQPLLSGVDINLNVPALLPEDYVPDVHLRLVLYKRLAGTKDTKELTALRIEMIDRFGLLPTQTEQLFALTALKRRAETLGIRKIDVSASGGSVRFGNGTEVDPLAVLAVVQSRPGFRMREADRLTFTADLPGAAERIAFLDELFDALGSRETSSESQPSVASSVHARN